MTSALKHCDIDLRRYLMKHRLPDLFESLFAALAVNQPGDEKQFIVDKILQLRNDPFLLEQLQWDTFIDDDKKPTTRIQNFNFLWWYEDENSQPTLEMLEEAYSYYNFKLLRMCYGGLFAYWTRKREKKMILNEKLRCARHYYSINFCRKHFTAWLEWKNKDKARQAKFVATLTKIFNQSTARLVFRSWYRIATEAKRTREYFERIERGETGDGVIHDIKKDHISLLPKPVAIRVFLFVDLPDLITCSKVCRTWKEITQAAMLWSRIDLANSNHGLISSRAIAILIQKCRPFLCHMNLRDCNFVLPKTLKLLGDCKNLQDLNLSQCKGVDDEVIKEISTGCTSLLYLNVAATDVSDASLRCMSRNCNSLQYLNIAHTHNITNRGMYYLSSGKGSQKLIYLDMSGCDQITKDGYKMLSKGCKRLNTVLLNEMPSLTDECVEALMNDCKNLRTLSILHSPLLSDASFKYIVASKKLQCLRIEGNYRLTDASIKILVKDSLELRHLYFVDIQRATDMSLKALAQCRSLIVLNVADCVRISDTGVRYIVEGSCGSKLREINLTNCIRVSDVSLLRISQRCHNLAYANFSYCEHITDAGVELLATISSLISLDLTGCNISDLGVVALGNNPKFRDINISECCKVTDNGIQKLVACVKNLETLDLSHLNQLTNQSLKNLAFCCRRLRVLNISGCHMVSDQGMQYLSGVCEFMEKLDISGCKAVTDRTLRYLRKGCHNIKILNMLYCRGISKFGAIKMRSKIRAKVLHSQEDTAEYLGNDVS